MEEPAKKRRFLFFWLIVVKPSVYGSVLSVSRYFTVRHVMLK